MALATGLFAQGTNIQFELKGAAAGRFKVIGMLGGQNYLVDSMLSTKPGEIAWKRDTPVPGGLYYLVFPDGATYLQMLLDKDQEFRMKGAMPDLIATMQVEGSIDNKLYYENLQFEVEFRRRLDSTDLALRSLPAGNMNRPFLENQRLKIVESRKQHLNGFRQKHPDSFFTVFKFAGQNPDLRMPRLPNGALDTLAQLRYYRDDYWNGTDLADERLLRTPVIPNKLKTYMTQLVPQAPDSVIKYADRIIAMSKECAECYKFLVNWIAIQYEKPTIMGGEAVLVHLVDKYFTDEVAYWFSDKPEELVKIRKKVNEMRPSLLGKTGQDIRCRGLDGNLTGLYELTGPAKILYMYSTSCSHCQERTPVLVDLLESTWKQHGLKVFALCLDPDEAKWKEFVAKYKMEGFVNVIDPKYESGYYKKYHMDITPELYILDANNKIIAKDLHPNQIDPVLRKAFGL